MWARWYGSLVERFRDWASKDAAVRAALIVGSQARADMPADQWSDLDIVIFHEDPSRLLTTTDWFQSFGAVVLSMIEPTAVGGSRERRVLYSDGRDVDFAIFPSEAIPLITDSAEGRSVLGRGFVVLLDKDHRFANLEAVAGSKGPETGGPMSEAEFQANLSDFYYHVVWAAKKLRRGEVWTAKMGCDGYLKLLLLRMIEWEAISRASTKLDIWHNGRFLDRWVPADVKPRVAATFGLYDARDLARALTATENLYTDLARQVADRRGWSYPSDAEAAVRAIVNRTLSEAPSPA